MARIRSVHPKLFTDEAFVSLSDAAQIFFIGLWTEADDYGAFEWKPISLKMRIRPASAAPVEPLLSELEAAERIMKYEHAGREYGLIRNFTRYQRPKFPKSIHFIPNQFRMFAGLSDDNSENDCDDQPPFPQKGEIDAQRKEGGDNMEEEGGEESSANADSSNATLAEVEIQTAVREWNDAAAELGLAKVQHLSKERKRKLSLRIQELGTIDGWSSMLGKIRASPFLKGENPQAWKVTFDWVLKPANLAKIMEGNYDNRRNGAAKRTLADDAADVGGWLQERAQDSGYRG